MSKKPRSRPLAVKVTREGVLTVEIGIDTLVVAALASPIAWEMHGPEATTLPIARFAITSARGFAGEVAAELTAELGEDGSTLIANVLDEAIRAVVEGGSQFFVDKQEGK